MKAFLREVLAAVKEGPALFFAPVARVIKAAQQPTRRPMK